jgi:serine/threonine protein kinase
LSCHPHSHRATQPPQEGDGLSPTAIREILLLRELRHEHIVKLTAVHVNQAEPSLSLAFDYAEHDLYEIIWHHRDRLAGNPQPVVFLAGKEKCQHMWCVLLC